VTAERSTGDAVRLHLALVGAQVGFALFPIFGKLALPTLPALPLAAFRVVGASLLLALVRRLAGAPPIPPAERRGIFLLALLGVTLNQVLFLLGLSLTSAINATILMTLIPIFTLAAAALLRHERLRPRAIAAIVLAGAGALLLLRVERFDWSDAHFRGNLLLLANGMSYSFYLVLSRPVLKRHPALSLTSGVFALGAPGIVLAAVPGLARLSFPRVAPIAWASLAAIILVGTVLPYYWNAWALVRAHASRVALYGFLQPLIASGVAVAVLGERITLRTAAAALLIFAGLTVAVAPVRVPARAVP